MKNVRPVKRLSCVLLAAGLSSRMGKQNKLLIDIDGQPLVRRTASTLVEYVTEENVADEDVAEEHVGKKNGFEEIIVVLGHEANLVSEVLQGLPVTIVVNDDYQEGQMTSVHKGVKALTKDCDGIMICLSDLVLLEHSDLKAMHRAFDECQTAILVPQYQGERGNPIILARSQRQAIIDGEKNLGCRKLIQKRPEEVTVFEAKNDHLSVDLDTPEALEAFRQRMQQRVSNA